MLRRYCCAVLGSWAAVAVPALAAEKMAPEFKAAWEGSVRKGQFAVVTAKGVPTTSVYGVDGQQAEAYFSVDIKGGVWQASQGIFDSNQVEADTLNLGEVMEVAGISIKGGDNRIDLRMVSVEAHKIKRADGRTAREPVSTNFKVYFPFPLRTRDDLPRQGPAGEATTSTSYRESHGTTDETASGTTRGHESNWKDGRSGEVGIKVDPFEAKIGASRESGGGTSSGSSTSNSHTESRDSEKGHEAQLSGRGEAQEVTIRATISGDHGGKFVVDLGRTEVVRK